MQPPGIPIRRCSVCNGSGHLTADGEAPLIYSVKEAINKSQIQVASTETKAIGTGLNVLSGGDQIELRISEKLHAVLPAAAASYDQATVDLKDSARRSFRGPAMELREALREVLDYLAPESDVQSAPGFTFDPGQSKPTMRQKAHFILKKRGYSPSAAKAPEDSVGIADELIASFVRGVYQAGAVAGHAGGARSQANQLKRYVDVALAELLELG